MRVLRLDFIERRSPLWLLGMASFVAALGACAYVAHAYASLSAALETSEAQLRHAEKRLKVQYVPAPVSKAESGRLQSELRAANRIISRLGLPWDDLFREIEASVNEQVALLSVEPDTERQEVKITAEAKDFAAMLEYERRLQTLTLFRQPHIVSHQVQQQDPQKPVRFVVMSQWTGSLSASIAPVRDSKRNP